MTTVNRNIHSTSTNRDPALLSTLQTVILSTNTNRSEFSRFVRRCRRLVSLRGGSSCARLATLPAASAGETRAGNVWSAQTERVESASEVRSAALHVVIPPHEARV